MIEREIPQIGEPRVWVVHSGRNQRFAAEFLRNGYIAIGYIKDVSIAGIEKWEDLRAIVALRYPDRPPVTAGNYTGNMFRFAREMNSGDYVIMPDGQVLRCGVILGDRLYFERGAEHNSHRRPVRWLPKSLKSADLSEGLRNAIGTPVTIQELGEARADEILALMS